MTAYFPDLSILIGHEVPALITLFSIFLLALLFKQLSS